MYRIYEETHLATLQLHACPIPAHVAPRTRKYRCPLVKWLALAFMNPIYLSDRSHVALFGVRLVVRLNPERGNRHRVVSVQHFAIHHRNGVHPVIGVLIRCHRREARVFQLLLLGSLEPLVVRHADDKVAGSIFEDALETRALELRVDLHLDEVKAFALAGIADRCSVPLFAGDPGLTDINIVAFLATKSIVQRLDLGIEPLYGGTLIFRAQADVGECPSRTGTVTTCTFIQGNSTQERCVHQSPYTNQSARCDSGN